MPHRRISRLAHGGLGLFVLGLLAPPGATGQIPPDTTLLTITGVVFDRGSGAPIPGAQIRFAGAEIQATTGDDGRYAIVGLPRGTYQMEVDAVGYRSLHGGLRMLRSGELNLPMDPVAGGAPGGRPSRIVGHVLEMESGDPLEGAEITVAGRASSQVSNGEGHFEIGELAPGTHTLSVRYLGRAPVQAEVEVPAEGTLEVEIRLAVEPVELAPMVVTAVPRNSYLEDMGFYDRRDAGLSGTQFTRQTLEEKDPRSLAELLVSVPGIRVMPGELGRFQVRMRRAISLAAGGGEGCFPALFVDDVRSDVGWLQDLDPARIEAMEIYSGANAPLRYNDACGVILVWTRRGQRGRERG
ncbi:MAG: carboxypeptidase regulatory-like domain-containing protein [Longimicrobiales bacterium]|nr:carboxypeptidase regulatory-like domain-containing protein [Longimicrobiales bacterium]